MVDQHDPAAPGEGAAPVVHWDEARARVAAGADPAVVATAVVAGMTRDERLWCLDGDAPTWGGLRFLAADGYHRALRRRGGAPRRRALRALRRRSARGGRGQRHVLPGDHGSRRDLGPRARGADRRRHRPRAARLGRGPHRCGVHQRAAPPGVGPRPGDLRRGSVPRRGDGRGADAGPAAPRDGLRQALRLQLDGERPLLRRHRGRRGRSPRGCTCRTSGGSSTRASPR